MASSSPQSLLIDCVVDVRVNGEHAGTGFFVAPGRVVTCGHVVARANYARLSVGVMYREVPREALVVRIHPEVTGKVPDPYPWPDLALLMVEVGHHPCVQLGYGELEIGSSTEQLWAYGFTDAFAAGQVMGTPAYLAYEGLILGDEGPRWQLRSGQVSRGMSGAPLLSLRTNRVCGVITRSRDIYAPMGAWATPLLPAVERMEGLLNSARQFHIANPGWREARVNAAGLRTSLRSPHRPLPPPAKRSPSVLLRPEHGVVSFYGRDEELTELLAWCRGEDAAPIWLITGSAGTGKTRLAARLCQIMAQEGWVTGFAHRGLADKAFDLSWNLGDPSLLVIDYAETRTRNDLPRLLQRLAARSNEDSRVRVLLLARHAGDWWSGLSSNSIDMAVERSDIAEVVAQTSMRSLRQIGEVLGDVDSVLGEAARAFAAAQELPLPSRLPRLAEERRLWSFLLLHMAALEAVGTQGKPGAAAAATTRRDVVEHLLERERVYWQAAATASNISELDAGLATRLVATANLLGAASEADAARVLSRVPDLRGASEERRRRLARWLRDLYPIPWEKDDWEQDDWLGVLQPDLLAEALVTTALVQTPELADSLLTGLNPREAERVLTLLTRATRHQPAAHDLLHGILAADLSRYGLIAIKVAQQTGDPIGTLLARVINDHVNAHALFDNLASAIPDKTLSLCEAALSLTQKLFQAVESKPESARLSLRLSYWHMRLGHDEKAIIAAEEATNVYRTLAQRQPEVFKRALANALEELARALEASERLEEAVSRREEAVLLYRQLIRADAPASKADLAVALEMLSSNLTLQDRYEESLAAIEEAVTELSALDISKLNDPLLYRAKLASAMVERGDLRGWIGRQDEAVIDKESGVTLYRTIAQERPDAFRDRLADALLSLANSLDDAGRPDEAIAYAEEAVDIYRELVRIRPDAYRHDLASALQISLAERLFSAERTEEGLAISEEAVSLADEAYAAVPNIRNTSKLSIALLLHGSHVLKLGRAEEAVAAAERAVSLTRELYESQPDTFRYQLVAMLINLAEWLDHANRSQEALAPILEVVTLIRGFAKNLPAGALRDDLPRMLTNLGERLYRSGRIMEALVVASEAAEGYGALAQARPDAFQENLTAVLARIEELRGVPTQGPILHEGNLNLSFPYWEGAIDKVSYLIEDAKLKITVLTSGRRRVRLAEGDVAFSRGNKFPSLGQRDLRRIQRRGRLWTWSRKGEVSYLVSLPYEAGTISRISYAVDGNYLHIVLEPVEDWVPFEHSEVLFSRAG